MQFGNYNEAESMSLRTFLNVLLKVFKLLMALAVVKGGKAFGTLRRSPAATLVMNEICE